MDYSKIPYPFIFLKNERRVYFMTLGELKNLSWLKFDLYNVDVFWIVSKKNCRTWLRNTGYAREAEETEDINELIELVQKSVADRNLSWEFNRVDSAWCLNLYNSSVNPFSGDYDDFTVTQFNLSSYDVPTIFIEGDAL